MMIHNGNNNILLLGCMVVVLLRQLSVSMVSCFSIRQQTQHGVCQVSLFASNQYAITTTNNNNNNDNNNTNRDIDSPWEMHEMTVSILSKREKRKLQNGSFKEQKNHH